MQLLHNISLKPYNTFGIDVPAELFTVLRGLDELYELAAEPVTQKERKILGGGSNVLLTRPVTGLLIANKTRGKKVIREDDHHVWLEVASGEIWHELVLYAIEHNWGGIENLALIPGTVGAAPIQNIGAYGVEVKDVIDSVCFWHWDDKALVTYSNADCRFGYRDSIFKQSLKDKYFITSVTFKLSKQHQLNTTYGAIEEELKKTGTAYNIRAIAQAVISIRSSKLPDPAIIGNAGSFFKNPTVSTTDFRLLKNTFPGIPFYKVSEALVKVPAGWLIEQCGWKGYRRNDAGVHEKQALVLVNFGKAGGDEIWQLSSDIVQSVKGKFGIGLEREVQVW